MKSEKIIEPLKKFIDDSENFVKSIYIISQNEKTIDEKETENVKTKDYTLSDLKQSLINKLNEQVKIQKFLCCEKEIELLKIILDYEK